VTILDTAGIRDSADPIEHEGVRRARARAAEADLVLWVTDLSAEGRTYGPMPKFSDDAPHWVIENKIDLVKRSTPALAGGGARQAPRKDEQGFAFSLSASEGEGVEALFTALGGFAHDYLAGGETAVVTRTRHRRALEETVAALDRAVAETAIFTPREELIAEELRQATSALGRLTGRVDVEDVLDKIFRDFCIGK
jgi:tRNA modification GTPase